MIEALIAGETDPEAGRAGPPPAQGQPAQAARGAARARQRASPLPAQAAPGPDRRARRGDRRDRSGSRGAASAPFRDRVQLLTPIPGIGALAAQVVVAEIGTRHEALPHRRPPAVLGLPVPAQRRERRQAPLHPAAPRRTGSRPPSSSAPGPRPARRAATCRRSSTACAPAAAPRRPSAPSPPRCSPPPGTCLARHRLSGPRRRPLRPARKGRPCQTAHQPPRQPRL